MMAALPAARSARPLPAFALLFALLAPLATGLCGCGFVLGTKPNRDAPLPFGNPVKLPVGPDGWTVFSPSADTLIAYVSASAGDDASASAYSASDPALGPDPFRPAGPLRAFRSYAAAREAVRDGYPDWILFNRGEVHEGVQISLLSGRSEREYSLVGAYGPAGLGLPELRPRAGESLVTGFGRLAYFGVKDLDGYCAYHDPASYPAGTLPPAAGSGIVLVTGSGEMRHGLFEGLRLRLFAGNVLQKNGGGRIGDIALRRCVVLDDFSTHRADGHSQGLFVGELEGLFVEECVFDHNGWFSRDSTAGAEDLPGEATMFNHNTYIADSRDVTLKDNVFLRSSSIQNKFTANKGEASSSNIRVEGNLYVDGEIGLSIGGNAEGPYRFKDVSVIGNVFTEIGASMPTNRGLAWYLEASDWDGGEISGNLMAHNSNPAVGNTYGIAVLGSSRDVLVSGNVVYGLDEGGQGPWGYSFLADAEGKKENIVVSYNSFQEPSGDYFMAWLADPSGSGGIRFHGNSYLVPASGAERAFIAGSERLGIGRWRALTGDNSFMRDRPFPDPGRGVASYQASLGGSGGIDGFIAACRAQNRDAWDPRYGARAVAGWIIAGFAAR